ncbi:carboxypeptidase N subunit 2-like [Chironomus tepperi]|uniref:carboxypeptidase N subunit 2-like n=1 Tax=Chironomus tepperi TaxID=113505 RepID=UPI00391F9E20
MLRIYGQTLDCVYNDVTIGATNYYACYLNIYNPLGFDNFTTIDGAHLDGRTDEDVTAILGNPTSKTLNIPRILCSMFSNALYLDYSWLEILSVGENELRSCRGLETILLRGNKIADVHVNAFSNNLRLININFEYNQLQTLPEGVFRNLLNLHTLELSNNPFSLIPGGLFNGLTSLKRLHMESTRITELNHQWFTALEGLHRLIVSNNLITELREDILISLKELRLFDISGNRLYDNIAPGVFRFSTNLIHLILTETRITKLNLLWFQNFQNLSSLYVNSNEIASIPDNIFENSNLTTLKIFNLGNNQLTESTIPENLFTGLPNLINLRMNRNRIERLNPKWFEGLSQLQSLDVSYNRIDELPAGIFSSIEGITELNFENNQLKTINRNFFGNLSNLTLLNLDRNSVNAIDERIFEDAMSLNVLYMWNNKCLNERFFNFATNRALFLTRLGNCMNNFRYIVDASTIPGDEYTFFSAPSPGIQFRVNSRHVIHIALSHCDFPTHPMVEIVIGCCNNQRTRIVRNNSTDVAIVLSPGILNLDSWTGFRITWANNVILVYKEGQSYPYIAYTMEDYFQINFFGIRSILSDANWSIQPVEFDGTFTDA